MNDEDFARQAFTAAFRSGQTGEPPTLPDVELLARNGRRANRNRHGLYAAGTTALAGVAVAGVVTGPSLLGLGTPSDVGTGAAPASQPPSSPVPSRSSSAPDPVKPSPGVPCAAPASINWQSVVSGALPKGVTATLDHSANCVQEANGSRSYEVLFKLSTGAVTLQVNVGTGPDVAAKLGGARISRGAPATPSPSESLDPTALASLEAQKRAHASAAASSSGAPGAANAGGIQGVDNETCSTIGTGSNACVSHLGKDSLSVVDLKLSRTGNSPIVVDVTASNGKALSTPAPGQLPSDATLLAIAQAVAVHF